MLSNFSYPIICTDDYVQTVNFYEDHFDFTPEFELPQFSILKRQGCNNSFIAIVDKNHSSIPGPYRAQTKGMILHLPVSSVDSAYQQFYWEGLNIVSEPAVAPNIGVKHFYVEDPNGTLLCVAEAIDYGNLDAFSIIDELRAKHKDYNQESADCS